LDIDMNTNASSLTTKPFICSVAIAACAVLLGTVQAIGQEVAVKIHVSTAGLDPSQPAGARKLYARLQHAAWVACTNGMRVDLEPVASFSDCYEKALGNAVHSVHQPQLNIVYLATHTVRDAATYDIEIPVQLAAGVTDWSHRPEASTP
jgi:UrcA family protein